ncbi:MAG: hypothetical protein B655_2311 [Methanobacterium sp. Maddingley MBC34]|nr:MAG: hypothetical protein B655_2311 [Methanobacterium sp. Maddingley MBC34]
MGILTTFIKDDQLIYSVLIVCYEGVILIEIYRQIYF